MQLSGLDAVGALSLFEPQPSDPSRLNHTIGLGATAPLALQCTLTLMLGGAPHAFNLSLSLANATLRFATRTPIDGSTLGALSLAALGQQPACAAQPLENASLVAGSPSVMRLRTLCPVKVDPAFVAIGREPAHTSHTFWEGLITMFRT